MDDRPIGIFDSGVGGLTVLSEIAKRLPHENLIYFGDTARAPYGPKSRLTVLGYARQISRFLLRQNVKMIVVACNTATALALDFLQKELPVPVLGVIDPAIATLGHFGRQGKQRVGVIGTRSTVRSSVYLYRIRDAFPHYSVFQKACPLFVSLVEEGWAEKKVTAHIAHEYLDELVREDVELLILGCTHYPLLKNMLRQEFPGFELIDGGIETAKDVEHYLQTNHLQRLQGKGDVKIFISDLTDYFQTLEKLFFGGEIAGIAEVPWDDLARDENS